MPQITRPQVYRVVREMQPRERFGPDELLRWLEDTQDSNERARRSHAKRRAALRPSPAHPSLNSRCNTSRVLKKGESGGAEPFGRGLGVSPRYNFTPFLARKWQGDGRRGFFISLLEGLVQIWVLF